MAVIWTDLRSNFEDETGNPFTVERARDFLLGLAKSAADRARRYINNAPPEVDTPLRRQCRKLQRLGSRPRFVPEARRSRRRHATPCGAVARFFDYASGTSAAICLPPMLPVTEKFPT